MRAWALKSNGYVEGIWGPDSRWVSINQIWSGHCFTPNELDALFRGEEVEVNTESAKTGKAIHAILRIEKDVEYNGVKKDRIVPTWGKKKSSTSPTATSTTTPSSNPVVQYKYKDHVFDEDELFILTNNGIVIFFDKEDNRYAVRCKNIANNEYEEVN